MLIHYNETGLTVYAQFDDDNDIRIQATEGSADKLRRYVITDEEIADAGLLEGTYTVTFRGGDADAPTDDDSIFAAADFNWSGTAEITPATVLVESGGGILFAKIGTVSLTDQDYLEIVQGEEKVVTFIVEAHGRFVTDSFADIVVKFKDSTGTVVTKIEDGAIERVCEALDVQVLRCRLSTEDTISLVAGLIQIEIAFDNQKAKLTHSLSVIEAIETTGTGM